MSEDNNNSSGGGGGRSLGGGSNEPLPSSWTRPAAAPRVGRIGDWSGASRYSQPMSIWGHTNVHDEVVAVVVVVDDLEPSVD